ncbi:MAG: hypothetical protein U0900_12975 [Myxococcota bacterium]
MDESGFVWEDGSFDPQDAAGPFELELGSLIAALSAWTEDETELELQLRAIVECGRYRIAIGCDSSKAPLEN